MDAEKLKGMAVVSISDGARLGRIKEVYFDTKALRIASFRVSGEGPDVVLALDDVKSVGADAVTVDNSRVTQVINRGDEATAPPDLGQMRSLKVVDEAGTFLGTVKAVNVEPATGQIVSVDVQKGGVLGLGGTTTNVAAGRIRSIGRDIMTVSADDSGSPGGPGSAATSPSAAAGPAPSEPPAAGEASPGSAAPPPGSSEA